MRFSDAEAEDLRRRYEQDGLTIEALALDVGADRTTVANALHRVGTQMRPPTAKRGTSFAARGKDGIVGKPDDPPARRMLSPAGGRRRRGRL